MENVKKVSINDMQPMLMIAKYPRATIRFCIVFKPLMYFFFIGFVGAFSTQLARFVNTNYQFQFTLGDIVSTSMSMSIILFLISTTISAAILQFLGKSMGGKGDFKQMFRAYSLSYIPYIWILPILLFWMQLSPESYFIIPTMELTVIDQLMLYIGPIFIVGASLWALFIMIKAVQEVQRFSMLKSILTFILFAAVMVALAIIVFTTTGLSVI